jgi:DNA-binding transcriptional ArsR family regulator
VTSLSQELKEQSIKLVTEELESMENLAEHIWVLSNVTRLRILKYIERKPRDVRAISQHVKTSYENTKKHLDKLMQIGVIKKGVGEGAPTSKGIHPVNMYSVIPQGLNGISSEIATSILNTVYGEQDRDLDEKNGPARM